MQVTHIKRFLAAPSAHVNTHKRFFSITLTASRTCRAGITCFFGDLTSMHWAGAIKTERKDAQRVPAKTFICSLSRNAGFFSLFCSKITIHNSELKKQVSGFIHGSAYFIGFSLKICRSSAATARRWCFRPRFGAKQRSFTASVTDIRVMIFTQSLKRCEDLGTVAKTAATQLFWTGVATDISAVRNRSATEDYY